MPILPEPRAAFELASTLGLKALIVALRFACTTACFMRGSSFYGARTEQERISQTYLSMEEAQLPGLWDAIAAIGTPRIQAPANSIESPQTSK